MEVQRTPPSVDELVVALKPILRSGLPVHPEFDDMRLLALRGVVARSIDRGDRLSRVKSLDGLLRKLLVHYPDDVLSAAACVMFGLTPGTRGSTLTDRRQRAAAATNYELSHFRKRIEPKILRQLSWQLHQDAQNYAPREREAPPPLEISGDTPLISFGDVSAKDVNEHEEALSRLWAHVYALRAEILKVERLKIWPHDETEPDLSAHVLREAMASRHTRADAVQAAVEAYIEKYGDSIRHGEGEFSARALARLAAWNIR